MCGNCNMFIFQQVLNKEKEKKKKEKEIEKEKFNEILKQKMNESM